MTDSSASAARAEMIETIRRQTLGPWAPRRRRVQFAYGYVLVVAVATAVPLLMSGVAEAVVQLVALVVMAGLWFALRRATRLVADAPEEALDELLVRLRNRAFLLAYQMLAVVVLVMVVVLFLAGSSGIGESLASALAWAGFGSALGLPLVVTAVGFPDVGPEPGAR
jgi:small-conductance mechanosensitive channel